MFESTLYNGYRGDDFSDLSEDSEDDDRLGRNRKRDFSRGQSPRRVDFSSDSDSDDGGKRAYRRRKPDSRRVAFQERRSNGRDNSFRSRDNAFRPERRDEPSENIREGGRLSPVNALGNITNRLEELELANAQMRRNNSNQPRQFTPQQFSPQAPSRQPMDRGRGTFPNNIPLNNNAARGPPRTGMDRVPVGSCLFCRESHLKRDCSQLQDYLKAGKLALDKGIIMLPDGRQPPISSYLGSMRQWVDHTLAEEEQRRQPAPQTNTHQHRSWIDTEGSYQARPAYSPPVISAPKALSYVYFAKASKEQVSNDEDTAAYAVDVKRTREELENQPEGKMKSQKPLDDSQGRALRYGRGETSATPNVSNQLPAAAQGKGKAKEMDVDDQATVTDTTVKAKSSPKTKLQVPIASKADPKGMYDAIMEQKISLPVSSLLANCPEIAKLVADDCKRRRVPLSEVNQIKTMGKTVECETNNRTFHISARKTIFVGPLAEMPASIYDQPTKCLVDSGSQINLMSESFRRTCNIPMRVDGTHKVTNVSGMDEALEGICESVPVSISGLVISVPFFVSKTMHRDVLLGQGFLMQSMASLDYDVDGAVRLSLCKDRKIIRVEVTPASDREYMFDMPGMWTGKDTRGQHEEEASIVEVNELTGNEDRCC